MVRIRAGEEQGEGVGEERLVQVAEVGEGVAEEEGEKREMDRRAMGEEAGGGILGMSPKPSRKSQKGRSRSF